MINKTNLSQQQKKLRKTFIIKCFEQNAMMISVAYI